MAEINRPSAYAQPLNTNAVNVLTGRSILYRKEHKTDAEMAYIHCNAPWVSLRSGVDSPNYKVDTGQCSPNAAKFYELKGVLTSDGKVRTKGFSENSDGLGLHSKWADSNGDSSRGVVPAPGITSFTVKDHGQYGMLLEAQVNIKAFSREQLDILSELYFQLGMTVLLEWGHTITIDKNGKVFQDISSRPLNGEEFYKDQDSYEFIEKVQKQRESTANYEACFGKVVNFNFMLNAQGYYDCSVTIVSEGSVAKGLQTGRSAGIVLDGNFKSKEGTETAEIYVDNYHAIYRALQTMNLSTVPGGREMIQSQGSTKFHPIPRGYDVGSFGKVHSYSIATAASTSGIKFPSTVPGAALKAQIIDVPTRIVSPSRFWNWIGYGTEDGPRKRYIRFRDLLYLINVFESGLGRDKGNVDYHGSTCLFNLRSLNRYVTFDCHFSLDPTVAVKPRNVSIGTGHAGPIVVRSGVKSPLAPYYGVMYSPGAGKNTQVKLPEIMLKQDPSMGMGITSADVNDARYPSDNSPEIILNLWICYDYWVGLIESMCRESKDTWDIMKPVQTLLQDLNRVFGNVNRFDILREPGKVITIFDANSIDQSGEEVPEVRVSGKGGVCRDVQLKSEVPPEMASMLSTGAAGGKVPSSVLVMTNGCLDRFSTVDSANITVDGYVTRNPDSDNHVYMDGVLLEWTQDTCKSFLQHITDLYKFFTEDTQTSATFAEHTAGIYSAIQLNAENFFKQQVLRNSLLGEGNGIVQSDGVVPLEGIFKFQGIGRLTVGEVFTLDPESYKKLLPESYKGWGFMVVSAEHEVTPAGWVSVVKTYPYPIVGKEDTGGVLTRMVKKYAGGSYNSRTGVLEDFLEQEENRGEVKGGTLTPFPTVNILLEETGTPDIQRAVDGSKNPTKDTTVEVTDSATVNSIKTISADFKLNEKSTGYCARYTGNHAKQMQGLKADYNSAIGFEEAASLDERNWYRNELGYKISESPVKVSTTEGINSYVYAQDLKPGDVIAMRSSDGSKYHSCIYTGEEFLSDFKQKNPCPYSNSGPFDVWIYKAPAN